MYKNTHITERVTAQIRMETFNTFNHNQWATVNAGISVPNPNTPVTASTAGSTGQGVIDNCVIHVVHLGPGRDRDEGQPRAIAAPSQEGRRQNTPHGVRWRHW